MFAPHSTGWCRLARPRSDLCCDFVPPPKKKSMQQNLMTGCGFNFHSHFKPACGRGQFKLSDPFPHVLSWHLPLFLQLGSSTYSHMWVLRSNPSMECPARFQLWILALHAHQAFASHLIAATSGARARSAKGAHGGLCVGSGARSRASSHSRFG